MIVQWYPGHMTKAKRMMQEDMKLIDLCIELLDARIPLSSRNPDIDVLAKGKARLILLNKSDLADARSNKEWLEYFKSKGFVCLLIDSKNRVGFNEIKKAIEEACKEKIARDRKRGIINRPVRAMIVGIPNVGKSTFINSLCKKACTKTGNKPGVTKGKQWIKLDKNVELLDTPGILWPKFEDENIGINLAYIGSINDEILDFNELAVGLLKYIKNNYVGYINKRYNVSEDEDEIELLNLIARARGCLKKQDEPDIDKASRIIIEDFRSGRLGKVSIEKVANEQKKEEA